MHISVETLLFKQNPTIWTLSRKVPVLPYACLFLVHPWNVLEKNKDLRIFPNELFKKKCIFFLSLIYPTDHLLLPDHLLKRWKGWTGFLSYIIVSQSVASSEVAVMLHHCADHKRKKKKEKSWIQQKQHVVSQALLKLFKCKWLKILRTVIIKPKSQLFCLESSFVSQVMEVAWLRWREAAPAGSCCPLMGREVLHSPAGNTNWLERRYCCLFPSHSYQDLLYKIPFSEFCCKACL